MDWHDWHDGYDDPDSWLSRRLVLVRERIRLALDGGPPGPLRVISMCAGQGRDLLGVLADHPRRADVTARLVELDPRNAAAARAAAPPGVEVVVGDAAMTDHYAGMVPADLVLMCGVFGNVTDADIEHTIGFTAQLCRPGGTVIWTRHRDPPDLVPQVCAWFEEHGCVRRWVSDPKLEFGIGEHRFTGAAEPLTTGRRMFTFVERSPSPPGDGA